MKRLDYATLMPLSKNIPDNKNKLAIDSEICKNELDKYLDNFREHLLSLSIYDMSSLLIAEQDWISRYKNNKTISESLIGKILKVDFGKTYLLENGLIHYAVCISECNGKYCVVPMTTSTDEIKAAFHPDFRPYGEKRLYLLKKNDGNAKDAALYINDLKFISSGRIIEICNKIKGTAYNNIINLCCEISFPKVFELLKEKDMEIKEYQNNIKMLEDKYSDLEQKYETLKQNNDILCEMFKKMQ